MPDDDGLTDLLNLWSEGDAEAGDALTPVVYDELQLLARRLFRNERAGHTLQPTALVHEAYARLVDVNVTWQDRSHFFALAARMMRRLLVNHANAKLSRKRGGDARRVTLDESSVGELSPPADILDVDTALTQFATVDDRKAKLVELQYFGGLTVDEVADVTGLSRSTVVRDLRVARAWLKDALQEGRE